MPVWKNRAVFLRGKYNDLIFGTGGCIRQLVHQLFVAHGHTGTGREYHAGPRPRGDECRLIAGPLCDSSADGVRQFSDVCKAFCSFLHGLQCAAAHAGTADPCVSIAGIDNRVNVQFFINIHFSSVPSLLVLESESPCSVLARSR